MSQRDPVDMPIDCIESAIGVAAGSHGHTQVQVCDRVKITSSTKIALLGTSFRMMIQDMNLNYNMFLIYVIMYFIKKKLCL